MKNDVHMATYKMWFFSYLSPFQLICISAFVSVRRSRISDRRLHINHLQQGQLFTGFIGSASFTQRSGLCSQGDAVISVGLVSSSVIFPLSAFGFVALIHWNNWWQVTDARVVCKTFSVTVSGIRFRNCWVIRWKNRSYFTGEEMHLHRWCGSYYTHYITLHLFAYIIYWDPFTAYMNASAGL